MKYRVNLELYAPSEFPVVGRLTNVKNSRTTERCQIFMPIANNALNSLEYAHYNYLVLFEDGSTGWCTSSGEIQDMPQDIQELEGTRKSFFGNI